MTADATYDIKPPSAVLAEDVICQSFIQSSSTLAYACLLIRRGRHDLAAHVLHSLEAKPASRFKDMVFYLQAQIGIEGGDFAAVKRRLVPRVHQHPNDMVALSLLAACVHLEHEDWLRRNPAPAAGRLPGPADVPEAPAIPEPAPEPFPAVSPDYRTLAVPTVPSARPGFPSGPAPVPAQVPEDAREPDGLAATLPAEGAEALSASAAFARVPDPDFGLFQGLAADPNTQALTLWNAAQRTQKAVCRKASLEPLVAFLPQALPSGVAAAVRALEGGEIHKICLSFRELTVTSLHAGPESLGLVTGGMNQGLLTMVRAENIFLKGAAAAAARAGAV